MSGVDMLEAGMMLHAHHRMFRLRRASIISSFFALIVIVIIAPMLICEILRSFVFVCAAIVLESAEDFIDI